MTKMAEQLDVAADKLAQIGDQAVPAQVMNVGNIERLVSVLAGGVGLLLLSRRLFVYVSLALLSAYLVYRGVTGRCLVYARADINTRRDDEFAIGGGAPLPSTGIDAYPIGTAEPEQSEIQRLMDGEQEQARERDRVEEASWESFPASDPPGAG